eukprot:5406000-Pyramimonas_sp.AAC.1
MAGGEGASRCNRNQWQVGREHPGATETNGRWGGSIHLPAHHRAATPPAAVERLHSAPPGHRSRQARRRNQVLRLGADDRG